MVAATRLDGDGGRLVLGSRLGGTGSAERSEPLRVSLESTSTIVLLAPVGHQPAAEHVLQCWLGGGNVAQGLPGGAGGEWGNKGNV